MLKLEMRPNVQTLLLGLIPMCGVRATNAAVTLNQFPPQQTEIPFAGLWEASLNSVVEMKTTCLAAEIAFDDCERRRPLFHTPL